MYELCPGELYIYITEALPTEFKAMFRPMDGNTSDILLGTSKQYRNISDTITELYRTL